MIHKTKEYRIWQRHSHIAKRKRICNFHTQAALLPSETKYHKLDLSRRVPMEWYEHDGQYNKGKIHCSCGLCKFGRKYGLPTLKRIREDSRYKLLLADYYASA